MKPKAIIFDLDDTLLVEQPSAWAAFRACGEMVAARFDQVDPDHFVETIRARAREIWYAGPMHSFCKSIAISSWEGMWGNFAGDDDELRQLREWVPQYRLESWQATLAEYKIDDIELARELVEYFPARRREMHVHVPGAMEVLEAVRPHFPLALVTNGASGIQREKLAGAGFAHYFDAIVISGEIGTRKPDPLPFQRALEALGVQPSEAIVVGNSLNSDIGGAHAAGIPSIWLNLDNKPHPDPDAKARPAHVIRHLAGLLPLLALDENR
ncbi:MAG: HAD family hydrolase [Candidatus Sumerlaeia bacterium]